MIDRVRGSPTYGRDSEIHTHGACPPMTEEKISSEVPSSLHADDLYPSTSRPASIASPTLPSFMLSDDDAQSINSISTQHYVQAKTLYHHQRRDNETLNSTTSLYDSDAVYHTIHGRRYSKDYSMPNDEEEQARLQMLNGIYYQMLGNRLTTVPLVNPKKILDIGTGIGDWAMAMGDEYPDAEIIGTDLAKIQPTSAPLNVFFEVDDAEDDGGWAWADDEFDFVHLRYLCGAFASWKHIYQETYRHLKPGGWIEVLDFDEDKPLGGHESDISQFPFWLSAMLEGAQKAGRPRTATHLDPRNLEELGFVDVKSTTIQVPVGMWPDDAQAQKNGQYFLMIVLLGMEAISLRLLTEHMGWTADAVRECCEGVSQSVWKVAMDPVKSKGLLFKLKVLVGRKPGGEVVGDATGSRPPTGKDSTVGGDIARGE